MAQHTHTQFLLMNTARSGDSYAEYTGVPVWDILQDAGILGSATGISAYSPDGYSIYHPLEQDPDPGLYHVKGVYPQAEYYYDVQADTALNPSSGWCNYSAQSCIGRNHRDLITNQNGLKMILAFKREGQYLDSGKLSVDNKLDGEGPFRVVPPQKVPSAPDQASNSADQAVIWPYDYDWDHNAGASARTVTMIRVEPLPEGTTDIDTLEAGWNYVDQEKIVIYGAINDLNAPVASIRANGQAGTITVTPERYGICHGQPRCWEPNRPDSRLVGRCLLRKRRRIVLVFICIPDRLDVGAFALCAGRPRGSVHAF